MEDIVRKFGLLILAGAVLFWAFGTVTANTTIKEGTTIEKSTVIEKDSKDGSIQRSEERRVGKECRIGGRGRWWR